MLIADRPAPLVIAHVDRREARFFRRDAEAHDAAGVLRVVPAQAAEAATARGDESTRRLARLVAARLAVLAAGDAHIMVQGTADVVRAVHDALPGALHARLES